MSDFDIFCELYGAPSSARKLDDTELASAAETLPDKLIEWFRQQGIGRYDNGLFRTVVPAMAKPLAQAWEEPRAANSIFLVNAFGCFVYRDGDETRLVNVWANTNTKIFSDVAGVFDGSLCDSGFLKNIMLRPEFRTAAKRLGPPEDDECFGFFPAIGLGGDGSADSICKVKLREHLALLAQL